MFFYPSIRTYWETEIVNLPGTLGSDDTLASLKTDILYFTFDRRKKSNSLLHTVNF